MPIPTDDFRKELEKIAQALKKTLNDLEDVNSSFPATQEFLCAKGLTHIRELDKKGRDELVEYLQKTYQSLLN